MITSLPLESHCVYFPYFFYTRFVVGDETKIHFWEDLWWGDQPLCSQFPRLFKVATTKNVFVSAILGSDTPP